MNSVPLSFLEAVQILRSEQPEKKEIFISSSCSLKQLEIFLKAEAALHGIDLKLEALPFGRLRQHLICPYESSHEIQILFLCPWDFIGMLDWRTGGPLKLVDLEQSMVEIRHIAEQIRDKSFDAIFYLAAPILPVALNNKKLKRIGMEIEIVVRDLGAEVLAEDIFSLDSYLANGCPLSGRYLGKTARMMASRLFDQKPESKKVIITDLDCTLWYGVLGEDGVAKITAEPDGNGYIHFIYQHALKRYQSAGVLIAIVSKNDEDLVHEAFSSRKFALQEEDFVSIQASYQPKSILISALAESLNLGLEHFVFIDDNLIELQEVGQSLPAVTCVQFPKQAKELHIFLDRLDELIPISTITNEDVRRTDLYRKMASSKRPDLNKAGHAAMDDFLRSLKMQLIVYDRSYVDSARAVQLINKANQFNVNGVRRSENEVSLLLSQGAKLYTGEILDVNGSHGEVLSILIDVHGKILSYVMSCRVFQRRAEFAFLGALGTLGYSRFEIMYQRTARNEPALLFIRKLFTDERENRYILEHEDLSRLLDDDGDLFEIIMEDAK